MPKENKSRYAILGMLALEPLSGYGIKKRMEQSTSNFWSESYGQIYPLLKQLAEEGLATSQKERQEGKPDRTIYTLTERGKDELVHWLGEAVEETPERIELLLKLFFGQFLPVKANIEHILRFREIQQKLLHKYLGIENYLHECTRERNLDELEGCYSLITLRYGIHRCQAMLVWCEETLQALQKLN